MDEATTCAEDIGCHGDVDDADLVLGLQIARTGVWELDLGDLTACRSAEHDRIFGYDEPLAEWTYDMFIEHVVPEDRENMAASFRHSVEVPGDFSFECRIRRPDGEVRWIWVSGRRKPGDKSRMVGIIQDITDRKRVEEALRRSLGAAKTVAKREAALKEVAFVSSSVLQPEELSTRIAETVARIFEAKAAQVRLLDESGSRLVPAGGYDPEGLLGKLGEFSVDSLTETAEAFRSGAPRVYEDASAPEVFSDSRRNASLVGVQSFAFFPVKVAEESIGVFHMGWTEHRRFSAEETSFMQAVVTQFSAGLQNARLYEAQRRRRQRIETLHGVLQVAVSSLNIQAIAQRILEFLISRVDFDMAALWLVNDGSLELTAQVGYPGSYADLSPISLADPYDVVTVFKTGERIVERLPGNPFVLAAYDDMHVKLGSYLVEPLVAGGRTIGIFSLAWHDTQELDLYDLDFYDSIADEIGVVLENARLYQVEHSIAETLQETLVVLPATVEGIDFARAYESATYESGYVGGDFVDVFEVDEDVVGIVVGDVSGKGISAAVVTSLVRNTLRVHSIDGLSAAEVVSKTNRVVKRFIEPFSFVTVWFGLLNKKTSELQYVGAGHPPALVLAADEQIRELPSSSSLVGAFANAKFTEQTTRLEPGERLVLYSDGVIEARTAGGVFLGELGLRGLLERHCKESTSTLARSLMAEVMAFSSGVLRDDAALLVVEPKPAVADEASA
ncbi:MAG: GAF domain-containing SpoIIE family protein phosphatase [Coriobacteriia bacterium]